jgi:predicted O-methyltransferase YrrM
MKCPVCEIDYGENCLIPVRVGNEEWRMCEFDATKVRTFIDGSVQGSVINIAWGAGRLCWSSWNSLRDIIRKNGITEILEFGTGLSSELFLNEGLSLISCDILPDHIRIFQKHQGYKAATFIPYPNNGNDLPDIEALYPGRQWDFVFVDGPQERSREVQLAMRLSRKFIYLHDPNMGEQHFFPNEFWVPVNHRDDKLFKKVTGSHHGQVLELLQERFGDREISGVEIGTAYGCLTKRILAERPGTSLVTIDPWKHDPTNEFESARPQQHLDECKEHAYLALAPYPDRVEIMAVGSDIAWELLKGRKFDFVWIDGDHTGPQVARDLDHYDPLVKPGGLIGGHDLRRGTPLTAIVEERYGSALNRGGDCTWWVYK